MNVVDDGLFSADNYQIVPASYQQEVIQSSIRHCKSCGIFFRMGMIERAYCTYRIGRFEWAQTPRASGIAECPFCHSLNVEFLIKGK